MTNRFATLKRAMRTTAIAASFVTFCAALAGQDEPGPAPSDIVAPESDSSAKGPIVDEISEEELAALALFVEALREVESKFVDKIDRRELVEAAIEGMLAKYDPYADYLPPDRYGRLKDDLEQEFGGVGVHLALEDSKIRVVSPVAGSPAHEAGVQPGDQLTAVGDVSLEGKSIEDVVDLLRGAPGSEVTLKALASDGTEKRLTMERRAIAVPTVTSDGGDDLLFLERCGARKDDRIGYLHVAAFNRRTADELRLLLAALTAQDVRGLVLDLRFNPGGLLDSGVEAADLFLASGTIASIRGRGVEDRKFEAVAEGTYADLPLVVLVNGSTASAAEIVAAALQDHDRAVVVGERTYGKGVVQRILPLEGGDSGVKLTSAKYYRPDGATIDRARTGDGSAAPPDAEWGVRPSEGGEISLSPSERLQLSIAFRERAVRPADVAAKAKAPDRQLEAACRLLLERTTQKSATDAASTNASPNPATPN